MENISLNQHYNQIIFNDISYDINNNTLNHKKTLVYNSSFRNYNNISIDDLNEDKNIYNRKIKQRSEKEKDMNLNKIKNIPIASNNFSQSYIPFSSRDSKKMKNNFLFYHNGDNKIINRTNTNTNANNNIQEKNILSKYPFNEKNKNDLIDYRILYKNMRLQNNGISKNIVHPSLNDFNLINKKFGTNHLYQTPKNVLISEKNENDIKPELRGKTKYRKIFNEKEIKEDNNGLNKIHEKNGYDSYKNIHKISNNNFTKPNTRDCITPYLSNRFVHKLQLASKNMNQNRININTDVNNERKRNFLKYNNQTMKTKNEIQPNEENKMYFSSNVEDIVDNNEEENQSYINIIKFRNKLLDFNHRDTTQQRENVLLSDNFNDLDTNFYSNRYTYFGNKKHNNNLFLNHLENSKRLSNKKICVNNNTDILIENKENINNNSKYIQDSFLVNNSINQINFESNLNKKIQKKLRNKKNINIQKNTKNVSSKNNNFISNRVIVNKANKINNSEIIKGDFSLNNKLKQDELGINLNTEIKYFKLKNSQNISLMKKNNNSFFKGKDDLSSLKQKNNNSNFINKNNKAGLKYNVQTQKENKNILKVNIKNNDKLNQLSNNLKINTQKNIIHNPKLGKKENIYLRKDLNNTNLDNFLKDSSLLSNNNSKAINSQQSQTTLNTSNLNKLSLNSYKSKYSNLDAYSTENKYIFSLYYSINPHIRNKNIKISVLCFDPEECSFKTKSIENAYFKKNFEASINKVNNANKSIYVMKNDDLYIVTGGNCNKFYKYTFKENKIDQKWDLKYNHSYGGLIKYNGQIICLSGNFNKKVEVFSENSNVWVELPEMQIERSFFSSCIIKNRYLFVFFGYNNPNKKYLDTIEFFDILNYNINTSSPNYQKENINIYWRYLKYNYFNSSPSFNNINLIGALAINYNDEKIILFGGKNCLNKENSNGYYQFILNENDFDENDVNSYIEKVIVKDMKNYFFNFDYKYLENLNRNNIMKEHTLIAFDNSYNIHLVKLSTMNHEIYPFNNK